MPLVMVELGDATLPVSECWDVAVHSSRNVVLGPSNGGVAKV